MKNGAENMAELVAFVRGYVVSGDVVKAYRAASKGATKAKALEHGTVLLGRADVQGLIGRERARLAAGAARGLTAEEVWREAPGESAGELWGGGAEAEEMSIDDILAQGAEVVLREAFNEVKKATGNAKIQALGKYHQLAREYRDQQKGKEIAVELLDFARGVNREFGLPIADAIAEATV